MQSSHQASPTHRQHRYYCIIGVIAVSVFAITISIFTLLVPATPAKSISTPTGRDQRRMAAAGLQRWFEAEATRPW